MFGRSVSVVDGDLLDQDVDVIVNPWNRNVLPWWLLIPHGVSGAIRKHAGLRPFNELLFMPPIPFGGAAVTSAGRLPFEVIIHVAAINILWVASEDGIRRATRSALDRAVEREDTSIAFPIVGSGAGGFDRERALRLMLEEIHLHRFLGDVVVVRYVKPQKKRCRT